MALPLTSWTTSDVAFCTGPARTRIPPSSNCYWLKVTARSTSRTRTGGQCCIWRWGQGNKSIIEYLLTLKDIRINQQDSIKRTPLHWAAVLGHAAIVELLLNHGADYLLPDNNGVRPLHYAVQNNNKDVVATMITAGNVTDEPDKDHRTALMWGALKGHVDVLRVLLDSRCGDINATDINHQTALHMSCQTGNLECVDLLICHQADINMMDKQDHIPLFYACASGHAQIVAVLLSQDNQKNLHRRDREGRTPLHYSAMVDRREIVNNLIHHELDPNARDNFGMSAPPYCGVERERALHERVAGKQSARQHARQRRIDGAPLGVPFRKS